MMMMMMMMMMIIMILKVGLGERGFSTLELQVVGPGLLGLGTMLVTLRQGRIFYKMQKREALGKKCNNKTDRS